MAEILAADQVVEEAQVVTSNSKMLQLQSCFENPHNDEAGIIYITEAVSFSKEKLEDYAKEIEKNIPASIKNMVEFKISEVDFLE